MKELDDLTNAVKQYKKISHLNILHENNIQNNKSNIDSHVWKKFNHDIDILISKMENDLK